MDATNGVGLADPPTAASRLLGVLGILGGLVLVAAFIPDLQWGDGIFSLRLVLFNAGAILCGGVSTSPSRSG